MQSFAINAARAINASDGGCGKVFAYRYHASQITTARYARSALAYVLNNWRKHRLDYEHPVARRAKLDPYSSALAFHGWTEAFVAPQGYVVLPVSPPRTRLLARDWACYGRIHPREIPGFPREETEERAEGAEREEGARGANGNGNGKR